MDSDEWDDMGLGDTDWAAVDRHMQRMRAENEQIARDVELAFKIAEQSYQESELLLKKCNF